MKLFGFIGILFLGACTSGGWQALLVPGTVVRGIVAQSPQEVRPTRSASKSSAQGPATFIEESLHQKGLIFGSDGSAQSLYSYLSDRFSAISGADVKPGDIVFFDLGQGCGGRVGRIVQVDHTGHIVFKEWQEGGFRESHATPTAPTARRDAQGRILNTFLRPIRRDDVPGTRYFAGEMVCRFFRLP